MEPTRLLPLLASLQMLPWPVSPEDTLPAPQLTVNPEQPVYLAGQTVTLTCSTAGEPAVSGIRFFRDNKQIHSRKFSSPRYSDTHSIQLSGEPGLKAGLYSCAFWKTVSRQEIPLETSQTIPIKVTEPLPSPQITVSQLQPVYITGEDVTLTCSAAGSPTVSGIRFYRDSQEIQSKELPSPRNNHTESLSLSSVSADSAGQYSCESWKSVSGQEIKSVRSQPSSIKVTARPPAPTLTVNSPHRVFVRGESVTLACSAPSTDTVSGIRFLRDGQRINSEELQWYHSNARSHELWSVSETDSGEYSCESWKKESGREIPSERSRPISITVTAPLPDPQLTVDPDQPVYIAGEDVTLTCSADVSPTESGIRFYRNSQEITLPRGGYTKSLQLRSVSAGEYSCESWKTVSGRVIKSVRSQPRSIRVTDPLPTPKLKVSPSHPVYISGEAVTLTCSAAGLSSLDGIRFYRDNREIHSLKLPSAWYSYTDLIQLSGVSRSQTRSYSCKCWKTVSGRAISSERSPSTSIAVTARPPPPSLSLDPPQPIYIRGEPVTLRCSGQLYERAAGYRFFNQSGEQISSGVSSQGTWQISTSYAAASQAYTCLYWRVERGREIPSEKSPAVLVSVTDPPSQPELSMDPSSGVVSEGFSLNITCTAPGDARERRFHFYKDGVKLIPGDLGSEISTMEPVTSSVKGSVLSIPWAGSNLTGEFTCEYKENVAGRWILSPRSWTVNVTGNITKSDSQRIRDILLGAGGILLLIAILAALLCYCCRKKRVPKTPKSADESAPREHARNLDPGHDSKGSKAAGAGAEQMKQGSEVTYALLALPASKPHTTRSKNKSKPVEDEHVLYSEVVTTHNQKKAK